MSQLPELPPCPFCGAVLAEKAPKSKYFIHPGNDCLLSHYEFDMNGNPDIARQWNVRAIASARREPLGIGKVREIERNHVYARTATLIDFTRAIEAEHGITGEPKHQQDGPESRASADTQGVHKVQESLPSALPIPAPEQKWLPIETAPKDERKPFLVLLPGNDAADYLVLQVSAFEGNMYPDHLGGSIDYGDRVTNAVGWMPLPPPPVGKESLTGEPSIKNTGK